MLVKKMPKFKVPKEFYPWPKHVGLSGIKLDRMFFKQLL